MKLNQVTVPCIDYETSCAFYAALGLTRIVDSAPRYARFECPAREGEEPSTFSLHRVEQVAEGEGVSVYFEVEDLMAEVGRLSLHGIHPAEGPVEQSWLWTEAWYRDPAGNRICLYKAGKARRFPPWRVDGRVE